jgi:hypothetical protein
LLFFAVTSLHGRGNAAAYIQHVVSSVLLPKGGAPAAAVTFVDRLRQRRWEGIVASGEIIVSGSKGNPADTTATTTAQHNRIKAACSGPATSRTKGGASSEEVEEKFLARSKDVALLFQTIADQGVLELCLGNYVEQIALIALGVEGVYPFFSTCFPQK